MPFPDVKLARRPLHFLYLCDGSGSMAAQGKMESLNQAIRQSLPSMAEAAAANPEAEVLVRVVHFASQAVWHIREPTPVHALAHSWQELPVQPRGLTAMGAAMELVATALRTPPMEQRALPPVLVLISDGSPTDDYSKGLQTLMAEPWAHKAVRLAIAMGHDANLDELQKFIGPDDDVGPGSLRPLQANDARTLSRHMRWASTAVIDAVSRPVTETGVGGPSRNVILPELPITLVEPIDANPDLRQISW